MSALSGPPAPVPAPVPVGGPVPGNRWDLAGVADPAPDREPDAVRVSVVVTHFEQPAELAHTLAALAAQTRVPDEIVVADDGSRTPPSVPAGVRLVRQADRGFRAAAARNLGAAATTGEVLCFLDADTAPDPTYVAHLSRLPALQPEAVVVGRRRHVDRASGTELPEPAWLREAYAATGDLLNADESSYRFVISAVLACHRWLFEELGGFDESFSAYGGEDWEWAHRAWTHGALLAHEPRAVAWHDGPDRAGRPGWDAAGGPGRARLLGETLAVAARVPVPGAAPAGLLLGPADPVVTLAPAITGDALVLSLDSLLAALPRAAILLSAEQYAPLAADPRCHLDEPVTRARLERSAWRHIDLVAPVTGRPSAWIALVDQLAGPGAPGSIEAGALRLTAARAVRRAARWSRADLDAVRRLDLTATGLHPVPDTLTTQARWGGWA